MRVAAIDCGTNSIRLLIADVDSVTGELKDVRRQMKIVRLGEGVDKTGQFAPAAIERTLDAVRYYADEITRYRPVALRFCATSAARDASNRDSFVSGVEKILNVAPEVITGTEEARLSFLGATRELPIEEGPFLVVDIGGGSTEFVYGIRDVEAAISVNIGCVRMAERHFRHDPPSSEELAAARTDIDGAIAIAGAQVPLRAAKTLIAVAGTATTVAAAALDLPKYDPEILHLSRTSAEQVHRIADRFAHLNRAERAALPYMHPGRVDVISAGSLVLSRIVDVTGVSEFVASEHDILDGIAYGLAEG
ncbi:MAG TPA: Ppx/GppA phosphatase family protein [Candidatus Nanopelagicaceae bacterium]|nr:Ppx/GppA phosphatase family protein [Candidatus Nanopelagicaceae bacterium]